MLSIFAFKLNLRRYIVVKYGMPARINQEVFISMAKAGAYTPPLLSST